MRASIRQVAARAGVSAMTVSRVLRGGEVAADTRARVLAAVAALRYVPVRAAVQNRHSETRVIGVVPHYEQGLSLDVDIATLRGVARAARDLGYDLLLAQRGREDWEADAVPRVLDRRADGYLFINPVERGWRKPIEALIEAGLPAVACYRRDVPAAAGWVDGDNDAAMAEAARLLIGMGHRRIAYLPGHETNWDTRARWDALSAAVEAAGRAAVRLPYPGRDWRVTAEQVAALRASRCTAVVAAADLLALRLWDALAAGGVRVPEDVALIGVDDAPAAAARGLTTFALDFAAVGAAAVAAWAACRDGAQRAERRRVVPMPLVRRGSAAPR